MHMDLVGVGEGGGGQQLGFPNRSIAVLGRSSHGLKEVHFISTHSLIFLLKLLNQTSYLLNSQNYLNYLLALV